MSDTSIKVENLSKQYRLGVVGTGTISHDLNRWWARVRGKEDPFLKIGETNDRSTVGDSNYVWALKDINFEVKQGEVLGIIGKNGAGKSTLLKVLSKVTGPSVGRILAKGRIGALLEVGTGFHPELTGRENIFLNGAILGMTKPEIRVKLDEIIDFSGCARYIDTPVKRYSSGMKVRLAFAVAAFLEPEILIVDEVLAVGDAEFQKKAIGKMQDVSKGEGRTVLFVSHNMASVQSLCTRGMVMENGTVAYMGNIDSAVDYYLSTGREKASMVLSERQDRRGNGNIRLMNVSLQNAEGEKLLSLTSGMAFSIAVEIQVLKESRFRALRLLFMDNKGVTRVLCNSDLVGQAPVMLKENYQGVFLFNFPKLALPKGEYSVQLSCYSENGTEDEIEYAMLMTVDGGDFYGFGKEAIVKEGVLVDYTANFL